MDKEDIKLLRLLVDGAWHEEQELLWALNCTRDHLQILKNRLQENTLCHCIIMEEAWRLETRLPLLNKEKIQRTLSPRRIVIQRVLDSTQNYIVKHREDEDPVQICFAELQTMGRGRLGRSWFSTLATQISFTALSRQKKGSSFSGLSLVLGLAVVDAVEETTGPLSLSLKWPNDILLNQYKVSGLLIELLPTENNLVDIVYGVGLNLLPPPNQEGWVGLSDKAPQLDKDLLAVNLVLTLEQYLERFVIEGFTSFRDAWLERDAFNGKKIRLKVGDRWVQGIEEGVDTEGALLLRTERGLERYVGNEISLCPD